MSEEKKRGGGAAVVLAGFAAIAIGGGIGAASYQLLEGVGGGSHGAPAAPVAAGPDTSGLAPEVAALVLAGHDVVADQGLCFTCHKVGDEGNGVLGPDLTGIGGRAASRVPGLSAAEYLAQSLYEPKAHTVEGFIAGTMMPVTGPPSNLNDQQILQAIAYLESLDGEVTVTPQTDPRSLLPGGGAAGATAAGAEPAAADPAAGAAGGEGADAEASEDEATQSPEAP